MGKLFDLVRHHRYLSLTSRFMLASLVVFVVGTFGVGTWVANRIESGVIHRTSATTALYVDSAVAPTLQDMPTSDAITDEQRRQLDWLLTRTALSEEIAVFKLWGHGGRVLYSTEPSIVGNTYPVTPRLRAAWQGEVSAQITSLDDAEHEVERQHESRLLEIYTPVRRRGTDEVIAVAEFYQQTDGLDQELTTARRRSWLIIGGATLVMYVLLAGFVQRASATIVRQQRELSGQVHQLTNLLEQNTHLHDRVRRAAARTAALNERFLRRFSAELHDGPAQELSLALLKLDNVIVQCAALPGSDACASQLTAIQDSVQRALKEVRTTSAGLLLPQLGHLSLPDTIRHVVRAHERRTGTTVALVLGELPGDAPLVAKIALYRLIQEALTNAARHADAIGQRVAAATDDTMLTIHVSDRGTGFDATRVLASDEHLGLVGMRERVESLGGSLVIDSARGRGTTVIAHLPLDPDAAVIAGELEIADA